MVRMDWDRILSTKAESLTDDEIEDLFPMVLRCDIDDVENIHNLRALMKLSQEMLQHKDNQVESLLLECDELKEKVSSALSAPSKSERKTSPVIAPDDIERVTNDSKEFSDDYQQPIKMKNDKIRILMQELESLEKENDTLKLKLELLKDEMEDATDNMNGMTEELEEFQSKNNLCKDKIDQLERENSALLSQIDELTAQQAERDKAIDDFGEAIDTRIAEWKNMLDARDAEISRLREELSQALAQSVNNVAEENTSEIVNFNEEIDEREKIIVELRSKLLEATSEMNESAKLIERLKNDAKKFSKTGRRKEHRDLLMKIQEANERISVLQVSLRQAEDEAALKSEQLCETLGNLRKYEDKDQGLAETIKEVKNLRDQLRSKGKHVQDLINVVNNLEALNSTREMQILALREKLGIPDDEEVSTDGVFRKREEETKKMKELMKKNESLLQDNLEMQSDIRVLRYKLSKLGDKNGDNIDASESSPKRMMSLQYHIEEEIASLKSRAEMDEMKENLQAVVEENEALRKGMHEILDSIHDQDGTSAVDVHSGTLETLLEALDVRHIAGWYHPAMRLQERLNVVEGSNAELRSQLKHLRKELQRKDKLVEKYSQNGSASQVKCNSDESETEETNIYIKEIEKIQNSYREELLEWQKEKESLNHENQELRETVEKLSAQFESIERDLRVIECGEDEMKSIFAKKSRESAESAVQVIVTTRKCATLENLLNEETSKSYRISKEAIELETQLRKCLADLDKRNKLLESEVFSIQSNLSNSISLVDFNELREKYEETNYRLRLEYESKLSKKDSEEGPKNLESYSEKTSAMNFENLHEISREKLAKSESDLQRVNEENLELRRKLIDLEKEYSRQIRPQKLLEKNENKETNEERIKLLTIENENLSTNIEIFRQQAEMHKTTNSLKIFEIDNLRHQILDLHSVSQEKETIARLGFELTICKATEIESTKKRKQMENEIFELRRDLMKSNEKFDETRKNLQDCRKICSTRCREYEGVIDFLRCQYAGSSSVTALQRFESMLKSLVESRGKIVSDTAAAKELKENAELQQQLTTNRLAIVERLKDILEQQIGSPNVENIMQSFSENSQYTLNNVRLKRRISQLENELKSAREKFVTYESMILGMEYEMLTIKRIWGRDPEEKEVEEEEVRNPEAEMEAIVDKRPADDKSTQAGVELESVGVQVESSETPTAEEPTTPQIPSPKEDSSFLKEQLDQALILASERSVLLIKCESQVAECQAKVNALEKSICEKDSLLRSLESEANLEKNRDENLQDTDKEALRSTIKSLQMMISQKEETIARYQNLLKDDRDEHSKAAATFQQEMRDLRDEISRLKEETQRKEEVENSKAIITARSTDEPNQETNAEEKIVRLGERASTLEAELHIAKELGERWHRLAEERLQHMDHMRTRLEEQHKNELESYRVELNKWQTEGDSLRQQLSENRMQLAKGNISMAKELQERDNKIQELTVAYQQVQNECEMMETMTISQPVVVHGNCATKMQEMAQALGRDQANHFQSELEHLRRQIKSHSDKEKLYKDQIAELKQQLSRRYMAAKSEERRISNREMQLERKLKTLEEELHKARVQLDREFRVQEAKRVKTAEELSLWEKQKKWQQIAEKLRKELKDKSDELKKLSNSYEKLKAVVSCMEREKWYLRSKLRLEMGNPTPGVTAHEMQLKIVENLQSECQTLRDRVKELTDRLESEDSREMLRKFEQQRRRISALEAVTEGNTFVIDQLEKLETAKSHLEKVNIRLESENFELRMEMEKRNHDTPRLREKVEHLEKYVELLKVEKSSESSPRSSDKDLPESKKSVNELEKTVFILKRVVEKLQAENKRLKTGATNRPINSNRKINVDDNQLRKQYEQAQKRVVALEADLQLAEQRIVMLENTQKEEDFNSEVGVLRQQLAHKSELLDKVKQLLTRAAINEKALRQKIQQIEMKQTLSSIPECSLTSSPNN